MSPTSATRDQPEHGRGEVDPAFGDVVLQTRRALSTSKVMSAVNGAPAAVGDEVPPGAILATAKDSLCQIVFNTKNIVHIAAGTTLRFDPKAVSLGATLQKGTVAMVLRNLNPFISAHPYETNCASPSERQQRWQESVARASLLR